MPSSENLFTLDPLKTSLTKPTTDVKVQGPANRSVENSQLLQGLKTFGNAVGSLAEVKKQKQITEDTLLAQNAAIKGEAEPGGIFGIASEAYDRIIEANTLSKASRDMQAFIDGADGADLINAGGAYSENIAAADKVFDTFKAYGASSYLNPQMLYDFYNTVETKRNKVKNEIALVNRDRNRNQVIQRIANVIEKTADVSKDIYSGGVESDSSDIEGTDEYPILFSLDSNITPELHNTLASDTVALNMGIERPEAKRLVLQMFLQNETVIAQPSLADKLMASEYSPGVTYEALYIKGALASNTDKDAADIFKMRNVQIQASFDHHKALDDQDKAEAEARTKFGKSAVAEILSENGSNENAYGTGAQFGLSKGEVNTLITAHNKFKGNLKHGINTPQGRALKREIENGQHLTEEEITLALFERGLKDEPIFKALVSREKTQTKSAQKAYDSEIKLIKEKAFQLLKGALNNNSAKVVQDADGNFDYSAMMSQMVGGTQGLDSNEVQDVILRLQRLQNDYEYRSNEAAREVARSDTFDRADVTKFGDDYNKAVSLFISDLKKNIISKTQVRDARKKEAKEEAKKKATEASAIAGAKLKEPRVPPKLTVIEEIENKKKILTDPTSHIKNEIDIIKDAYKSLFSTDPKPAPKSSEAAKKKSISDRPISESEQAYLKKLEQSVPTSPSEESVSKTGLGSFADRIDANFAALPDIINDMQRERVLQKGLNLFFEGAVSDFKESFPVTDLSRDRAFEEAAAQKLGFGEETPTDAAEVPAGGGSEEQLVGKGLSEPGPTPTPKGSHRVQRGETLSSIAQNANTTVDKIAKLNNITDPQTIQAGAMLKLPDPTPLELGKWTGKVTSEGRKVYENNLGGVSSEYTVGVKDSKINNRQLTHIPSIYNGKIVTEQEAIRIISENKGIDPETGRFITPGGDPEARSKSISIGFPEVGGPIPAGSKSKKSSGGTAGRTTNGIINSSKLKLGRRVEVTNIINRSGAEELYGVQQGGTVDISVEPLDIANTLFSDPTLFGTNGKLGKSKVLTSLRRSTANKSGVKIRKNSSHNEGKAVDLRATWEGDSSSKTYMKATEAVVTSSIIPSLEKAGWKITPSKDNTNIVIAKKKPLVNTQVWVRATKGTQVSYIEIHGGKEQHIHIHTGEGFAGGEARNWELNKGK